MRKFLAGWDLIRLIRLIAGVGIGLYAVFSAEYLFLMLSGLLVLQALFNVSCCGAGACSPANDSYARTEVYKGQIKEYKNKK